MTRAQILAILDGTHPAVGRRVALGIYVLIVVSAIAVAIETLPGLSPLAHRALIWLEYAILALFTLEFATRLICAPRLFRYLFSFWGIIDFLAIVPALIFIFPDLQALRALRLLRLARLFKLLKASAAIDRIARAFEDIRAELGIFLFFAAVVLYLAAVGIYHLERHAQPETFGSIPASLWWAVATLTTVGYGDVYPVTTGGRVFTGFVLLIGIGIVAVPAGLITSALLANRRAEDDAPAPPDTDPKNTHPNKES